MHKRLKNFRLLAVILFLFTVTASFQGCGDASEMLNGAFAAKSTPGNGQGYEGLNDGGDIGNYPTAQVFYYIGDCADQLPESIIVVEADDRIVLIRESCMPHDPPVVLDRSAVQMQDAVLIFNGNGYLKR